MKIKKRQIFFTIMAVFLLLISISILTWILYKKNIKSLLNTSIDSYVVLNFDNYSKNKNAQFLTEEIGAIFGSGSESSVIEANKYSKFLDNVFLLHLNEDLSSIESITGASIIMGIDAGALFIPAVTQLGLAFEKLTDGSGIYRLNGKMKKELDLPKDMNVFLKPYKGMFLLSLSQKHLKKYSDLTKYSKRNDLLIKDYIRSKDELLFFGGNFKKTLDSFIPENVFIQNISNINGRVSFDPYFGKLVLKLNIEGEGDLFSHLSSSALPDRPLIKYIKPGSYYIANNNFIKLVHYISGGFVKMQDVDYLLALKTLLGFDILDILKLCGNEIIIGNNDDEYYAMSTVREKMMLQGMLSTVSVQSDGNTFTIMDKNIYLRDDKIFFNNFWDSYDNDIFITKETFFYSKMPISKFNDNPSFDNSFIEIDARYDPSYNIMAYIKISKEDIKRLIQN